MKKVFLAGASGVIGIRVAKMLVELGYEAYGTTRSQNKAQMLEQIGIKPVVLDVFDTQKLKEEMKKASCEILMHQLTDLPDGLDYAGKMDEVLARNARIRTEGTRNLIEAAKQSGVKTIIAQSLGFIYEPGDTPYTEQSQLLNFNDTTYGETSRAVASLEEQVLGSGMCAIVLRNGLIYGEGTGFDIPFKGYASVHVDAAAKAVVLALQCKQNEIFNIVDTDNITSNDKAKTILGWDENFRI